MLKLNYDNALIEKKELLEIEHLLKASNELLVSKSGAGNEFLGWLDIKENTDFDELERIKKSAEKIKNESEALLVIGIGGSYLGAKAAIEALTNNFYNELDNKDGINIYFAGNNMSPSYISDLYNHLKDKDFSINVISKSGTTTEPAISFRIFKDLLIEKYKEDYIDRIYITTDKNKGALKSFADENEIETFVVPDEMGGRFSVLSAVGLLPICCAGINIDKILEGAFDAEDRYKNEEFLSNDSLIYSAIRNILYNKGKTTEILVNYTPELLYFSEWAKQLLGESEGKDGKGIFPASASFTTDLHSLGQIIQAGRRNIFETVIMVNEYKDDLVIKSSEDDLDGLNYLSGMKLSEINKKAFQGTLDAHVEGDVPNIVIELEKLDEYNLSELFYFYERSCAVSGYMLGVNPFDQPGVEKYKTNMFKLLGKPGF